ncbi:hypothetical protein N7481_007197 [Penicillium waksmanii]|uniref:uncharacterized protein n=1 Tax=Penicillium waksmanii TaxID=69791 RepID=UPI00254824BD|nr:uncharacterized protein N7481_007197 [Penicillium waksmanii]KAJ5979899.1 hypothetical protein N7481_007197 [Penicillium waksmanii]
MHTVTGRLILVHCCSCGFPGQIDAVRTTGQAINNLVRLSFFVTAPIFVILAINDAARDTDTAMPFALHAMFTSFSILSCVAFTHSVHVHVIQDKIVANAILTNTAIPLASFIAVFTTGAMLFSYSSQILTLKAMILIWRIFMPLLCAFELYELKKEPQSFHHPSNWHGGFESFQSVLHLCQRGRPGFFSACQHAPSRH